MINWLVELLTCVMTWSQDVRAVYSPHLLRIAQIGKDGGGRILYVLCRYFSWLETKTFQNDLPLMFACSLCKMPERSWVKRGRAGYTRTRMGSDCMQKYGKCPRPLWGDRTKRPDCVTVWSCTAWQNMWQLTRSFTFTAAIKVTSPNIESSKLYTKV